MARPRVLITGFGPFPGVADNPSAWLAETLAAPSLSPRFEGELHARVVPTAWESARLMPRLYEALQPHVMIHFGVSLRAKAFRIERFAYNRAAPRADAEDALPPGPEILREGVDRFDTALPAASLAAHLRARGHPAVASSSAGSYVCNCLYYHSLDWAARQPDPPLVLFVHIPKPTARGAFTKASLLRGAHETVRFVLSLARADTPPKRAAGSALARAEVLSAKDG
jgi:pyroglutamyl-peptidase